MKGRVCCGYISFISYNFNINLLFIMRSNDRGRGCDFKGSLKIGEEFVFFEGVIVGNL